MGVICQQAMAIIDRYGLDMRSPQWAGVKARMMQGRVTEQRARGILRSLLAIAEELDRHPNYLAAPTAEDLAADPVDIELGTASESDARYGLWLRDRARQCLLSGVTGCGKSTLQRRIVMEVAEFSARSGRRISTIVFDSKKDFRDFRKKLPGDWQLFSFHENLKVALVPPLGVPPQAWFQHVAVCFAARTSLIAARRTLAYALGWLFDVMNPDPTAPRVAPTLGQVLQLLERSPKDLWSAKPEYLQSLISALHDFTLGAGRCMNCESGLDLDRDVATPGMNVILGLEDISPPALRLFLIDVLVSQAFLAKLHRNEKADETQCCFVFDEADQNISRDIETIGALTPLISLFKQGREYGCMAVASVSSLKGISPLVLANTSDKFIFNTDDSESLRIAMATLLMPAKAVDMLPALRPGECIIRQGLSNYPKPFLGRVDYVAPDRDLSPPDDPCPYTPARELDEIPGFQEALDALMKARKQASLQQFRLENEQLSEPARRLLAVMAVNPWAPAATLWRLTGKTPSPSIQKAVRKELVAKKLVEAEETRLGRANVLLYLPTLAGFKYANVTPPKQMGRGSITHQHISHWIAMCGEKDGYKARCEFEVLGARKHAVDCAWQIDADTYDVFEVIVTCEKNIVEHLTKLAPCSCVRTITIVCTQKREIQRLQASLGHEEVVEDLQDRLRWELAETYLRKAFP